MKTITKVGAAVVATVITIAIALPSILHNVGLHPDYNGPKTELPGKRALIITTSHGILNAPGETTGDATGVMASEMTHPYYTFLDGGMQVDIASIKGGETPIDPQTFSRPIISPEDKRYLDDAGAQAKAKNSIKIDDVDISQYDIVFISGGWGAAYDLAQSEVLAEQISNAYYADKQAIIGGVCHGVLGLVNAKDQQGNLLIAGRKMTGVTDKQIKQLGIEITPLHPETELRKAGVIFESQTKFIDFLATHVSVDKEQRFVTGQNQNSGLETAHTMMAIIANR
ncbi:MAG: putative intracellular protease/amidase [Pseudomonadales bacterium]|jgi:putative intracellular protease/amidase